MILTYSLSTLAVLTAWLFGFALNDLTGLIEWIGEHKAAVGFVLALLTTLSKNVRAAMRGFLQGVVGMDRVRNDINKQVDQMLQELKKRVAALEKESIAQTQELFDERRLRLNAEAELSFVKDCKDALTKQLEKEGHAPVC